MSRDKQIEEIEISDVDILANDINQHCPDLAENYCGDTHCVSCLAHALTQKGYRKASEVAKEIFEEIESSSKECWERYKRSETLGYYITASQFAKLKQKYESEVDS